MNSIEELFKADKTVLVRVKSSQYMSAELLGITQHEVHFVQADKLQRRNVAIGAVPLDA
jgi:hypothetical protein